MEIDSSPTLANATTIYDQQVDRLTVARYYLESELPNIIRSHEEPATQVIHNSIEALEPEQVWRLLEALSYTFRINGVFARITDEGLDWKEVELPIQAISLSGTRPHINDIVYSEEIQRDPQRFAAYLNNYFDQHPQPEDDPQGLNEFRPRSRAIRHETLFTHEREGRTEMLDGTHRLIALAMAGVKSLRCYSAVLNGKPRRSRRGDSTFATLQKAYTHMPEHRSAILEVTEALARDSVDGMDAVQTYWIDYPRSPELKQAGQELLNKLRSPARSTPSQEQEA